MSDNNKIAIIGMSCRFPGGANTPEAYWDILKKGDDVVTEIGLDRWGTDYYLHADRKTLGKSVTFAAGVLDQVDQFDAAFFGISPREAAQMDPQQRLLLELTWESLEDSGYKPDAIAGSKAAVYIGIASTDYVHRRVDDLSSMDAYSMTGNTASIASNRISYVFDLHGPSVSIDTACSSSLVALHQACNVLRNGEAPIAITGGVNMLLHPFAFVGFSKASMISERGRCRAFDESGDGYVRSEGAAIFVLKPLAQAEADGDNIHGVIVSSGINCDGKTKGITVPSPEGQAELLDSIYSSANIDPNDLTYIEAHGTGTAVGDPREAEAIGHILGQQRNKVLPIGSAKTNLGHLETASGMAGLMKAILISKQHALPQTVHFETPNKAIDFEGLKLKVVDKFTPLAEQEKPLLIGVNSFGFGGANAHVLLEEYKKPTIETDTDKSAIIKSETRSISPSSTLPPLIVSARQDEALQALAADYKQLLEAQPKQYYDVAYSAFKYRQLHQKRLAVSANSVEEIITRLDEFATTGEAEGVVTQIMDAAAQEQQSPLALVFSGNGSQWQGMAQVLLANSPLFKQTVTDVDNLFSQYASLSLLDEFARQADASRLAKTEIAQPLLFALQVGLVTLMRSHGLRFQAVTGHSVGEVAAAWAAGALSLEQAVQVIFERSKAQGKTAGSGRMAAVGLSADELITLLDEQNLQAIELAGINSQQGVTLSGSLDDLETLGAYLTDQGVFYRLLDLDYAFHSSKMDAIQGDITQALANLKPQTGDIDFISTVTGDALSGEALNADYWWKNIREPVQFSQAIDQLLAEGITTFVEVGPHPILRSYIQQTAQAAEQQVHLLSTVERNKESLQAITHTVNRSILIGCDFDETTVFPYAGQRVALPSYPWQRERHWYALTSEGYNLVNRHREHPLLGYRVNAADTVWENHIDQMIEPWLAGHVVDGGVIFPAAGYVEMALAAANIALSGDVYGIDNLEILAPIVLEHTKTTRLVLEQDGRFQILSKDRLSNDAWTLNTKGRLIDQVYKQASVIDTVSLDKAKDKANKLITADEHYQLTHSVGLDYGDSFQAVKHITVDGLIAYAELTIPESIADDYAKYHLHPSILDGCFQALVDIFADDIASGKSHALIPVQMGQLIHYDTEAMLPTGFKVEVVKQSPRSVLANVSIFADDGTVIAEVINARFRGVQFSTKQNLPACYQFKPWLLSGLSDEEQHAPDMQNLIDAAKLSMSAQQAVRADYYQEFVPLLDVLVTTYAWQALTALSDNGLLVLSTIDSACQPLALKLIDILIDDELAVLQEQPSETSDNTAVDWLWQLEADSGLPAARDIWLNLLANAPDCLPELTLLGRCGEHLVDILQGNCDVKRLLNDNNSQIYQHWLGASASYQMMQQALLAMLKVYVDEQPVHQRLRILELGEGSVEWTAQRLALLPSDQADYVVVSDNEDWLAQLSLLEERYPFLSLEKKDSSALSANSELDDNGFDLILISHGSRYFSAMPDVLAYSQCSLNDNGRIMLLDTPPNRMNDLVLGSNPDWWLVEEGTAPISSHYTTKEWTALLTEQQFSDITRLSEDEDLAQSGAFILTASKGMVVDLGNYSPDETAIDEENHASEAVWLGFESPNAQGQTVSSHVAALVNALASDGVSLSLSTIPHSKAEFADYWQTIKAQGQQPQGLVWLDHSSLDDLQQAYNSLHALTHCVQSMEQAGLALPLTIITHNATTANLDQHDFSTTQPAQAALWGFGRVLMNEHPDLACRLIDLRLPLEADEGESDNTAYSQCYRELLPHLAEALQSTSTENEIILTSQARYATRMQSISVEPSSQVDNVPMVLDFKAPGPLKNLYWKALPAQTLQANEIEIRPYAAGLNFRDVMYAMGLLSDEAVENGFAGPTLGMELSGIVTAIGREVEDFSVGDEVIGFAPACFSTRVITQTTAVAHKPVSWSYEAAATVPTTFFTVYYALHYLAHLEEGDKVLIHGAAGGVGIAAIQYARSVGAEIFATAGTEEKRDFVRMMGADHVMDSRSLAFAEEIMTLTQGEGIDVVLNSLAGEAVNRNLAVLKPFGRFLELGKRDYYENNQIGLRPFRNNIAYFGIDADQLLIEKPKLAGRLFKDMMELFEQGQLRPLPHRVFKAEHIEEAFRYMQQSRQIGKVIVSLHDPLPSAKAESVNAEELAFKADASYIITGGSSGFGLKTALWMAKKGAGELLLLSRSGQGIAKEQNAQAQFKALGCHVYEIACDVSDESSVQQLFQQIGQYQPLKGIVHAAMVIDDALIRTVSDEAISRVLAPKVSGAWHLHHASLAHTTKLGKSAELDYFIMYSSATTYLGNPGQANYVAANSFLEALATQRKQQGLPATFAAWGAIDDVGFLANNEETKEALQSRLGGHALASDQALARLEQMLVNDVTGAAVIDFEWSNIKRLMPAATSPKYSEQLRHASSSDLDEYEDIRAVLETLNRSEAEELVATMLLDEISHILRLSKDNLNADKSVTDLGMDSLMGMELVLAVEERFGVKLPVMALTEGASVKRIAERIIDQLDVADDEDNEATEALDDKIRQAVVKHGSDLSEEEADQLKASLNDQHKEAK